MKKLLLLVGVAIAFVAVCAGLSPVQSAPADATFTVNDQGDAVDANPGGGGIMGCCTNADSLQINNTAVLSNAVVIRGATGAQALADAGGILASAPATITNSTIRGNRVSASGDVTTVRAGGPRGIKRVVDAEHHGVGQHAVGGERAAVLCRRRRAAVRPGTNYREQHHGQ